MADVPAENVIHLGRYVKASMYKNFGAGERGGTHMNMLPLNGNHYHDCNVYFWCTLKQFQGLEGFIYDHLKDVPNMEIYRKANVPVNYHYSDANGLMPLQLVAKIHYVFSDSAIENETVNGNDANIRDSGDRKHMDRISMHTNNVLQPGNSFTQ